MSEPVTYLHIVPQGELPPLVAQRPFRAVLVLEAEVGAQWQAIVSNWLVEAGCLYALSVGVACSSWDDSIDWANIEKFGFKEIPLADFVMTTWHEDEFWGDVFGFAKHSAFHPTELIKSNVLVHVAYAPREAELLRAFVDS